MTAIGEKFAPITVSGLQEALGKLVAIDPKYAEYPVMLLNMGAAEDDGLLNHIETDRFDDVIGNVLLLTSDDREHWHQCAVVVPGTNRLCCLRTLGHDGEHSPVSERPPLVPTEAPNDHQ